MQTVKSLSFATHNRITLARPKILLVLASLVATALLLTSCEKDGLCLRGNGNPETYDLAFADFDKIELAGPINLQIEQGAEYDVQIVAEPEIYRHMKNRVRNNRLEIGFEDSNIRCFDTQEGVWVYVTVPDLQEIRISGESELISSGNPHFEELGVIVSGVADIEMSGLVDNMSYDVSGDIEVRNFDLVTDQTSIKISGAAYMEVSCNSRLDIDVSGAATIKYKGHPEIFQDASGSLSLINMN